MTGQLVNALCEFDALRIQFVSLHEGVDTSTPNGRLVFGIFASIAEFERELIRERVRSGMAARAQGASWHMIARELGVGLGTVRNCGQNSQRVARLQKPFAGHPCKWLRFRGRFHPISAFQNQVILELYREAFLRPDSGQSTASVPPREMVTMNGPACLAKNLSIFVRAPRTIDAISSALTLRAVRTKARTPRETSARNS
ncbi:MAG: hypothetical protein DMG28_07485 [Acidobacteria bacterium]|nr:MAG: hypothetical protein DMG28_07485 [Acidobacteriota bacterium]